MARARTSLPVPLSPRRSTVVLVPATFETRSRIGCILLLVQRAIRGSVISCSLLSGIGCTSQCCLHRIALHVPRVYPPPDYRDYKDLHPVCAILGNIFL